MSLLVVFSYSQKLLIFVLQYGLEALEMLGGSACCIRLDLKVDDFCCKVRERLLRCTFGGSACCIQLKLKVVYSSFTVRARGS